MKPNEGMRGGKTTACFASSMASSAASVAGSDASDAFTSGETLKYGSETKGYYPYKRHIIMAIGPTILWPPHQLIEIDTLQAAKKAYE